MEKNYKGWTSLNITTKDNIETVNPENDWSTTKDEETLFNSCALNSIYNGVDKNIFKIINTCTSAKKA